MFTDMVGYSALVQADEGAALQVLERHNRLLRPLFARFGGHEVKTIGDAFLVEFESALDAVRCATEIQRSLHEFNQSSPEEWKIRIRIGVHVGDVVQTENDVLGDAVNIASRIQALAEPEGVSVTQQVVDQVTNKIAATFSRLPPASLKNIRLPVIVYRIVPPWEAPVAPVLSAARAPGRQLAVLPLANISPDPGDGYFADGLTEELISVLSQVRGLSVIARTSVMPYKTAPKSVAQVGVDLGVDTVLEGSVRKAGNRIRITLQLIDVASQRHLWASSYNRELDDVFAVQEDIAERTAEAMRLELTRGDADGEKRRPTENLAAYEQYLRGLASWTNYEDEHQMEKAIAAFEEATRLDPGFAEAFAAWANTYVVAAGDLVSMPEVIPKARELANRALQIDPESSEAHSTMGNILFQNDNDWARAEAEFKRAIELNPSNVTAHRFYGLMLFALGRFDESIAMNEQARRLDPGGHVSGTIAWVRFETGDYEAALQYVRQERDEDPSQLGPHVMLGMYSIAIGRRADAEREADRPISGANESDRFDHAILAALLGRPEEAREWIRAVARHAAKMYVSQTHLAMLHSAIGETSQALDLLERAYAEGDRVLWLWHRGVYFDAIRNDPRFVALLRRYGLPIGDLHRPLLGASGGPGSGHARRRVHSS